MQEFARRRHRQRDDNKDQRPVTRLVRDVLDGIWPSGCGVGTPGPLTQRDQAHYEDRQLDPFTAENFSQPLTLPSNTFSGPCLHRGARPGRNIEHQRGAPEKIAQRRSLAWLQRG